MNSKEISSKSITFVRVSVPRSLPVHVLSIHMECQNSGINFSISVLTLKTAKK